MIEWICDCGLVYYMLLCLIMSLWDPPPHKLMSICQLAYRFTKIKLQKNVPDSMVETLGFGTQNFCGNRYLDRKDDNTIHIGNTNSNYYASQEIWSSLFDTLNASSDYALWFFFAYHIWPWLKNYTPVIYRCHVVFLGVSILEIGMTLALWILKVLLDHDIVDQ